MRLPPIAEKLRPAREILARINADVRVDMWLMDEDGVTSELKWRYQEGEPDHATQDLIENLIWTAGEFLPRGYMVVASEGKFIGHRLTAKEMADYEKGVQALDREYGDPKGEHVTYCYRIEPAAEIAFDPSGKPIPFYGYTRPWMWEGISAEGRVRSLASWPAYIAGCCLISPEHVVPISVEEYLANGGVLEG